MGRVEGKTAIVTGGGSGIGRAICLLMANEGAKVAILDLNGKGGQETQRIITDKGQIGRFWHVDVSREEDIARAFFEINAEFGKINILVNNAGILGVDKPTDEITEEEWDKVLAINTKGVFLGTKHAVPYMRKAGGGSIINISSIYAIRGTPSVPPYHAAKAAVRIMSKVDALLYAKDNIRVNSVLPGIIMTPLLEQVINSSQDPEDALQALISSTPLGRLGTPENIAQGVLYLASDESSFVTGSDLVIDGGYTAK